MIHVKDMMKRDHRGAYSVKTVYFLWIPVYRKTYQQEANRNIFGEYLK